MGRVLPLRKLRPHVRRDQPVRPGTAGRVCGQAPQTQPPLGHEAGDLRVTRQPRADHLVRNRLRPQALSRLAGTSRMPAVKNVGEPCAGKPHARFDGEGLETEPTRPPRQPFTLLDLEYANPCHYRPKRRPGQDNVLATRPQPERRAGRPEKIAGDQRATMIDPTCGLSGYAIWPILRSLRRSPVICSRHADVTWA